MPEVARTNEAKCYSPAKTPTSKNAATGAKREDPPTKDLTRGTKDIDDGNVRCTEDPRTSAEASAKGTSTESTGTTVLLESALHETQTEPQDSLPLTPRPPIDGEPHECKQEVVESVVTAERTKGTVQTAEPRETVMDVDRAALLGRKPAERVHRADEGDEERDNQSQLQQTRFYCKERHQHNKNAKNDIPHAHGLPLEGEWSVCASGESSNLNGDADASNAAVEHVYGPSESRETEGTMENELKGCEGGMGEQASIDKADGNPGCGVEPTDTPNKSDALVIASIQLEEPGGSGIPRMHLRGENWHAGDTNGPGHGTDALKGLADALRARVDTLNASNKAETNGMSWGEGADMYLSVRDAKRVVNATDGIGIHADASNAHTDMPSIETDAISTANPTEIISTPPK